MQVQAVYRSAKISAFKAREVTRAIQGLPAQDALDLLKWTPRKAARFIDQTLRSAIANAENNNNLRPETLVVKEAIVGEGPSLGRFQPKARGSAGPIIKRTSHIRIVLTDDAEAQPKQKKAKEKSSAKAGTARKSAKKTAAAKTEVKSEAQEEAPAPKEKTQE